MVTFPSVTGVTANAGHKFTLNSAQRDMNTQPYSPNRAQELASTLGVRNSMKFQQMLFENFASSRTEMNNNFDNRVSPTPYHEHLTRSILDIGKENR